MDGVLEHQSGHLPDLSDILRSFLLHGFNLSIVEDNMDQGVNESFLKISVKNLRDPDHDFA